MCQAIARRRYRLLSAIAALCALLHRVSRFRRLVCAHLSLRRLGAAPLGVAASRLRGRGTAVGLLVHPHFPKTSDLGPADLRVLPLSLHVLDVGSEILPNYTDVTLMVNLGWALGLGVLWLSTAQTRRRRRSRARSIWTGLADVYGVAAVVFSKYSISMSRFSLYRCRSRPCGSRLDPLADARSAAGRACRGVARRVPLALAAAACIAVSAPEALRQWKNLDLRTQAGPGQVRLPREAFSAALPPGALVAAPWQQTSIYMLWAPQALYHLNVLDPVFLAAGDPARHTAQANVFSGEEPDVPLAVAAALDSQLLTYSPYAGLDLLTARLEHDPRVAIRHRLHGFNLLWTILPDRNDTFILDWFELPSKKDEASPTTTSLDPTLCASPPSLAGRTGDQGGGLCRHPPSRRWTLRHARPRRRHRRGWHWQVELAPWGASTAWLNGNEVAGIGGKTQAVLGRGVNFALDLVAGDNLLAVRTCAGKNEKGPRGFYCDALRGDRRQRAAVACGRSAERRSVISEVGGACGLAARSLTSALRGCPLLRHAARPHGEVDQQRVVFNAHYLAYMDDALEKLDRHHGRSPPRTRLGHDAQGHRQWRGRSEAATCSTSISPSCAGAAPPGPSATSALAAASRCSPARWST